MDEESTQVVEDTGLSETAETSTNEETQDTDDIALEDMDISSDDPDETDESKESTDDEAATEESEESEEESIDDGKEERKRLNDEAAKARIARKQALEQAKRDHLQQRLYEAEDDRDLALRELQNEAYNTRVEANTSKLETGLDRAVADIDLFKDTAPTEARDELMASLDDFERMYVTRNQFGDVVKVEGDIYQFLQQKAASIRKLTGVGARQQAKAKQQVKARTDTLPSKAPKEAKVDADLKAFDDVFNS